MTKDRMPLPVEISSLCSTLYFAVWRIAYCHNVYHYQATLQLAHSCTKEFRSSCPRNEFNGLLTESTAWFTITKVYLVDFQKLDCCLHNHDFKGTYHLLQFAVERWIHDACCRVSRLNSFTDLSMQHFSNHFLFIPWWMLIMSTDRRNIPLSAHPSGSYDQLFYALVWGRKLSQDAARFRGYCSLDSRFSPPCCLFWPFRYRCPSDSTRC